MPGLNRQTLPRMLGLMLHGLCYPFLMLPHCIALFHHCAHRCQIVCFFFFTRSNTFVLIHFPILAPVGGRPSPRRQGLTARRFLFLNRRQKFPMLVTRKRYKSHRPIPSNGTLLPQLRKRRQGLTTIEECQERNISGELDPYLLSEPYLIFCRLRYLGGQGAPLGHGDEIFLQ